MYIHVCECIEINDCTVSYTGSRQKASWLALFSLTVEELISIPIYNVLYADELWSVFGAYIPTFSLLFS